MVPSYDDDTFVVLTMRILQQCFRKIDIIFYNEYDLITRCDIFAIIRQLLRNTYRSRIIGIISDKLTNLLYFRMDFFNKLLLLSPLFAKLHLMIRNDK